MFYFIGQNKLAFVIIALVMLALLTVIAFSVVSQVGGFEMAGISITRYCAGSGGVCTGGV